MKKLIIVIEILPTSEIEDDLLSVDEYYFDVANGSYENLYIKQS
ncbi:MAG: hypothetical protein ACN6OB_09935 [Chryseobacterium jejuense]